VRDSNRQARDAWERWAPHRVRVTAVLEALGRPDASLCILGPGNLNDVHLDRLAASFETVDLVDLDIDATHAALAGSRIHDTRNVHVHQANDLTSILDRLPASSCADSARAARSMISHLQHHRCTVGGQTFDATASTGLLTQMLQSVVDSALLPDDRVRVGLALRDKHLADLVGVTRAAGTFVLISDVVASTTAPQLVDARDEELEPLMAELVAAGNFFTGTNPYRIVALLEEDERFRHEVDDVRLLDPWRWAVTADRFHLVYAIVARRSVGRGA
jgi:hypothetical protein